MDRITLAGVSIAAIGSSPNANGMTLTGQQLNLQPANASFGGVVTTAAQSFAGAKTFTEVIIGTDPGGSELLRVGGAIYARNIAAYGQTSGGSATESVASGFFSNPALAGRGVAVGYDSSVDIGFIQARHNGTGVKSLYLQPQGGSVIIGTDPGGSELLRVGGGINIASASRYKINDNPVISWETNYVKLYSSTGSIGLFLGGSGDKSNYYNNDTHNFRDEASSLNIMQLDKSATATHTRMLIWDVDNGQLERVSVGAADSGGAGFKLLRIPN